MSSVAESGLFPPIINAYIPALNIKEVWDQGYLPVTFNLSEYNTLSDIISYHISITRQSNYHSLLNSQNYPLGIYGHNFSPALTDNSPLEQTINIPISILNQNELSYNEYYKFQIRLSKISIDSSLTGANLSKYLNDNLESFSEWSTVCLIRFISPATFNLSGGGITSFTSSINTIHQTSLIINGEYIKTKSIANPIPALMKNGTQDNEYLSSYKIQILNDSKEEVLFDSGEQSLNIHNPNHFSYRIPYYFENGFDGYLRLSYITANLYENQIDYRLQATYSRDSWASQSDIIEITSIDSVIGKVNISFEPGEDIDAVPASTITIRRASDEDNFTVWDTIWIKTLKENELTTSLSYDDFTIESGVLYKYEITYTKNNTSYFIVEGPIISVFDYSFLTGEGTQLCIKFNPNVSSFKRNVSDNIVTTIGSQFPFITRNGSMNYRTFSLSGTIAYEMDARHQFASRSTIYGDWINVYGSYFVNRYINQSNDRITQRKFREIVMDYLYNDIPKLFRSTPEGNILVRITDVNLTPKQELSRMIYDFSCTATEIGEPTIENMKMYKVQDFGEA